MRTFCASAAGLIAVCLSAQAANIKLYSERSVFESETLGRTPIDFESLRNACVAIPETSITVSGIVFSGGAARGTSSGSCAPTLTAFRGYVLNVRLLVRATQPAQSALTATPPADTTAIGVDLAVNDDPVVTNIEITVATADGKEQAFNIRSAGTGTGGGRRVSPVFAGITSSRAITGVRFRVPENEDTFLVIDNFTFGRAAAPAISSTSGALNGASFQPVIAANTWVSLFGSFFSGTSRLWEGGDFNGTRLPTQVEDVSVTINGRPAYVAYVSPTQLNVLTPADLMDGPATIEVTRGTMRSNQVNVQAQRIAPALFMFDAEGRRYVAANHVTGAPVGKTTLYPGATVPARPGDILTLWGTGFGRTNPAIPAGEIVSVPARLLAEPVVTVGGATAEVQFAGLTIAGVYQFNVRIPQNVPDGDLPVAIQVEGTRTQEGAFLTVQR